MQLKKIFFIFASLLVIVVYYLLPSRSLPSTCAFCDPKVLDYQTFYEDELAAGLYSHKPVTECHLLIIPKRHVTRYEELKEEELLRINYAIKKVDLAAKELFQTSSYLLLQKNGVEVGQTVPHLHFHYIARKKGDNGSLKFLLSFFFSPILSPIKKEQMHCMVEKLRNTI